MIPPKRLARRLREIVGVAVREGLSVPVGRMRVAHCVSWRCSLHCTWRRWTGHAPSLHPWPEAVRASLVRLGPAFVKIGQILSVRSDLVPPALAEALRGLQSKVPPASRDQISAVLAADIGRQAAEAFQSFDQEPLAAGSVAQIHRAKTHDGHDAVVKIKRPDIDPQVTADLDILCWLAEQMERHLSESRVYRPSRVARELKRYTLKELDFQNEANVARTIRNAFAGWHDVIVPEIYLATRNVIVMEYVDSFPLNDKAKMAAHGIDRLAVVRTGVRAMLRQIFEIGLFHGDPHPGNLQVTPDGRLVFLDFGIFGSMEDKLRRLGALLVLSIASGDIDAASYFLFRLARVEDTARLAEYKALVAEKYREWRGSTVEEYGFGRLLLEILTLGARHGLTFPSDLVLLSKTMVTIEGVAREVAPSLNLADEIRPYFEKMRTTLFSPVHLYQETAKTLPMWWDLAERLPSDVVQTIDQLLRGVGLFPHGRGTTAAGAAPEFVGKCIIAGVLVLAGTWAAIAQGGEARLHTAIGAALMVIGLIAMARLWRRG